MESKPKKYFYAVRNGRKTGVYHTWEEAREYVQGFPSAKFKKFATETEAEYYLKTGKTEETRIIGNLKSKALGTFPILPKQTKLVYDNKKEIIIRKSNVQDLRQFESEPKSIMGVWTDGSSLRNGKKDCVASYAVFFGNSHPHNFVSRIKSKPSNQIAELMAIHKALSIICDTNLGPKYITIYTDSMYSINCITKWYISWQRNGWKTKDGKNVKHSSVIQDILRMIQKLVHKKISFEHVLAHKTPPKKGTKEYNIWYGNDCADKMARGILR